ncbi:MAG TPA: O-antigen ligase family protein [Thermoanaerobaculia bacterium]|nr:O-antigen ligase family protein [Thermoanaerobaculia bacterium]
MIGSTVAIDRWADEPMNRSPGTGVRILLFLLSIIGSGLLFGVGFAPAAPDRLPVLVIAVGLALAAAWSPARAIVVFAFLFPCAGLLTRLSGGTDPVAWPALLFGGLAAGWSFRFIYDFDSMPEPSPLDRPLRALVLLWTLATVLAVARASTLWAALRGLTGRAVNGDGLPETAAVRESLLAFSALFAGAAFFLLLRRQGPAVRLKALRAALLGVCVSALAACLQGLGLLPPETRPYWKLTGRITGASADPNSLGLLCALALVLVAAGLLRAAARDRFGPIAAILLAAGLLLSGSRAGFLLLLFGVLILFLAGGLPSRSRLATLVLLAAAALGAGLFLLRGSAGTLGTRLAQSFDPKLPIAYRVSERPLLWRTACRLFLRHPVEGGGMGVFAWQFPDLMKEENRRFLMRDNPGSAYVQALAETGAAGFLLTAFFAVSLGALAMRRAREKDSIAAGSGVAAAAFLAALAVGSHWFAADVSLLFFLLASLVAGSAPERAPEDPKKEAATPWLRRSLHVVVLLYAVAAGAAVLATARPEEAFRHSPRIGFHDEEVGPGGPFRWTRRRFALWVERGQTRRILLAHYSPSPRPVEIDVTLGGPTVFRRALKAGESATLRLNGSTLRPQAFLFEVSRSFVPRRLGLSEDRREIGLLSIEPR